MRKRFFEWALRNVRYGEKYLVMIDGDELIKADRYYLCCNCLTYPTSWVSISFEAPFCSVECLTEMWEKYQKACNGSNGG